MPDHWDQFLARILSSEDKLLFDEAIRSARSDARRAAYIMVWLSCAESLKRKFRELSPRDGNAKAITGECERKELAHQSIDHFLLEKARDYGLITTTEFTKLEQIYACRCIYGHPYETGPTELNILSAASDVIEFVLSKPTKLRHGYLSTQVDHLTTRASFLDDRYESVERFAIEVAQKCDETLHWWFLEKLWEKAEAFSIDKSMELFFRRAAWFSMAYLKHILGPSSAGISFVNYFTKYPNTLASVLATPKLFSIIDDHSKEFVFGTIVQNSKSDSRFLPLLKSLNDAQCLDDRLQQRFQEALDACTVETLAAANLDPNLYIGRIIAKLKRHDWYTQNPAVGVIKNIGREGISQLTSDHQFTLGNNILQAADGGANRAVSFLTSIANASDQWPEKFVEGLVAECFVNDDNVIRFKPERMHDALNCLKRIDSSGVSSLLGRLVERIRRGRLKPLTSSQERAESVAKLEQFASENNDLANEINNLTTVLNSSDFQNQDPLDFG